MDLYHIMKIIYPLIFLASIFQTSTELDPVDTYYFYLVLFGIILLIIILAYILLSSKEE